MGPCMSKPQPSSTAGRPVGTQSSNNRANGGKPSAAKPTPIPKKAAAAPFTGQGRSLGSTEETAASPPTEDPREAAARAAEVL